MGIQHLRFRASRLLVLLSVLVLPGLFLHQSPSVTAQITSGGSFGSAVPCLDAAATFATSCFADTIVFPAPANDAALVQFTTTNEKKVLAPLGSRHTSAPGSLIGNGIGSVYGLAYDDGAISGVKRLFAGAYTRRLTSFGSGGAGGIYSHVIGEQSSSLATIVPNAGVGLRGPNDTLDLGIQRHVGRSGLGDLEISPDGRTLYVANLAARRIEVYDISTPTIQRTGAINIPWSLISNDPAIQADLVPFALEFHPAPLTNIGGPALVVGITDTATRGTGSRPTAWPSAHLLTYFTGTNHWAWSLSQDLVATPIRNRHQDTSVQTIWFAPANANNQYLGWNPWRDDAQALPKETLSNGTNNVFYPQPLLTDIEFSHDGKQLWLGLRDRTGDLVFAQAAPPNEVIGIAQGDVLAYRAQGAGWVLETVTRSDPSNTNDPTARHTAAASDYFNDNLHAFVPGPLAGHLENQLGGLATNLTRVMGGINEQIALTTLLGAGNSGVGFFPTSGGNRTGALQLVSSNTAAGGKSGALGDLELLCTYAFIHGRVWQDTNGNGRQDGSEPGFSGIVLEVYADDHAQAPALARATTDASGNYRFAVAPNSAFKLRLAASNFTPGARAAGWQISPENQGSDDRDSDLHSAYGYLAFADQTVNSGAGEPTLLREEERVYDIGLRNMSASGVIGNLVWHDLNRDGLQDANEPGITNAPVTLDFLSNLSAAPVPPISFPATARTDNTGTYRFTQLTPGVYRVTFGVPNGFNATRRDAGDDSRDSDVDAATGYATTVVLSAAPNDRNETIDFGAYSNSLDLRITKTGAPEALVGTSYSYTLNYTLSGNSPAAGVTIEDTLPSELSYISANPAPNSRDGNKLTWNLGTLNPGATGTISIQVRAPATINTAIRTINNTAQIRTTTTVPADTNPANNTSSYTTRIVRAEVSVEKSAPSTVLVGDEFSYTMHYASSGGIAAANVELRDPLPVGLSFVRFESNPGGACSYRPGERLVVCQFHSLPFVTSGTLRFVVKTDSTSPTSITNTAAISTATAGDHPANNTSSVTTIVQRPDLGASLTITPNPWPVGTSRLLRANYTNSGTGVARNSVLQFDLPAANYTLSGLPNNCSYSSANRRVTCALGDVIPGASGSRSFNIGIPADFPADSFSATVNINSTTPERTADLGNNTATARTDIVRPNVWVTANGPNQIVAQGSVFWYVVDYGNRHHRAPNLTRAAENVQLRVTLPSDVRYQGVNGAAPGNVHGSTLTWNLGTLAPQASGQLIIVVQTNVPAGAQLNFTTQISTTTPGDNPSDNQASVRTDVVQPPTSIPAVQGDLRLAMRSELDPNSQDGNPTNGVYLSTGTRIAWPTGEVLDFTPRLQELRMAGEPLPWPYAYRARVVGWSIAEFQVNGTWRSPQAADARGRTGCRPGTAASATQLLTGCRYAYLGGTNLAEIANPPALREDQLRNQAHVYWTQPPAPTMRDDVYLYTVDPLAPARIRVQLEVEISIVNAYPGAPINDPSLPEIPIVPLPDPARRMLESTFTVELLVPRSVIGPGR